DYCTLSLYTLRDSKTPANRGGGGLRALGPILLPLRKSDLRLSVEDVLFFDLFLRLCVDFVASLLALLHGDNRKDDQRQGDDTHNNVAHEGRGIHEGPPFSVAICLLWL